MSDKMQPVRFDKLIDRITDEYRNHKSIFGIPEINFFRKSNSNAVILNGERCDIPVGPAAGPHTQMTQNIVAAYLCGGRFFELKTVQKMDELEIPKPCISAEREGYNTEWSTEFTVPQAYDEYLKAWMTLHFLNAVFDRSVRKQTGGFIFNMSVGYDLTGIRTPKIDRFIEELKDAAHHPNFRLYQEILSNTTQKFHIKDPAFLRHVIETIPTSVSTSVTLSTMHGCAPNEIETICRYLLAEKRLHTFVKLNPTLLGFDFTNAMLKANGFNSIELKRESFDHDLQFSDAIPMLRRLKAFAAENDRQFGVKLSNTLPVKNTQGVLPGDEMYMSGEALYPLTIHLAAKIAEAFDGALHISYSGGANYFNLNDILQTGIYPITLASDLLKPGGYLRLRQLAEASEKSMQKGLPEKIDVKRLCEIASKSIRNVSAVSEYCKDKSRKSEKPLPLFDCFIAPCRERCPIHQDVPTYIRLVDENHHDHALESIMIQNPLPHITGYICDHQCMTRCTRRFYDESVKIRDLKHIATETGFPKCSHPVKSDVSPNGIKVAILGAGPAGLSAGYFLVQAGFSVTIFDRNPAAGGTVRFVIPGFRLPEEAVRNDIAFIEKTGVKFQFGVSSDLSVEQLKKQGYRYIFLAIGAGKSNPLVLKGKKNENLIDAIDFLRTFRNSPIKVRLGKNVVVIGGGNSAMDAARAALKVSGVQNVTIIYRRTISEMPADREEIENAISDGVTIHELLTPAEFSRAGILKCQKMRLGEPDDSDRRRPVPIDGEFEEIQTNFVISAIGENVETEFLCQSEIDIDRRGNVVANPITNETNISGVFIGGDARLGPATIVEAIAEGKKVAAAIILRENPTYKEPVSPRHSVDLNEIYLRKGLLKSAEKDLNDPKNIHNEASRCLDCQTYCGICVDVCPNRANFAVKSETGWQIVHIDGLCNECGNCATFCPWNGKPYRKKFTIFRNEQDFTESESDGILLNKKDDDPTFRLRLNSCEKNVRLSDLHRISNSTESAIALNLVKSIWDRYRFLLEN